MNANATIVNSTVRKSKNLVEKYMDKIKGLKAKVEVKNLGEGQGMRFN